jgi:hypothetical protein
MKGIIFDIDGTLALAKPERLVFVEQEPKDWQSFLDPARVATDDPIPGALRVFPKLVSAFGLNRIIYLTGRNDGLRAITKEWIQTHFGHAVADTHLIMRPIGNLDKPTEFKWNALTTLAAWTAMGSLFDDINIGDPIISNLQGWLAFDDDKYMMQVYPKLGIIPFHAPNCWDTIFPEFNDLETETNWRR